MPQVRARRYFDARYPCTLRYSAKDRFYDMPNSAAEAETLVEIGKANILDQRRRIERQRELIARLERDGSPDLVADAVRILGEMEQGLAAMEAHHTAAQARSSGVGRSTEAREGLALTHPWRSSPYRSVPRNLRVVAALVGRIPPLTGHIHARAI
jgi:hypothetical protein